METPMLPSCYAHVFAKLENVRQKSWGWMACCPAHDDVHPSLSLSIGDRGQLMMRCHRSQGGCPIGEVLKAMELTYDDIFVDNKHTNGNGKANGHARVGFGPRKIVATYDYRDEIGELLFQAVRFEPKSFAFCRQVGDSKVWNLQGTRRVLYRLPEILANITEQRLDGRDPKVAIVEGEKDADNCWRHGIAATTSPMGSGNWLPEFNDIFRGCNVVIVADRDKSDKKKQWKGGKLPGEEHAAIVASNIHPVCSGVKILTLPGDGVKDFSDWQEKSLLSKDDLAYSFWGLVCSTPHWHPPRPVSVFEELVSEELARARQEHERPFSSVYEGAGVLVKEFEEFKVELARKSKSKSKKAILDELVQIAAMCRRVAEDQLGIKK